MSSTQQFHVGIIGYGLSAKVFHIPFISLTPSLVLHSIVQRSPAPGNSAPDDFPSIQHFTDVSALLSNPSVDIVIVSTPPNTHFSIVRDALLAGKHVLVEKPFVPSSSQAYELAALARKQNRILCVYQNRRCDSDFLTVQKLLRDDHLGRVIEFETHFDRFRPEKPAASWKADLSMDDGGGVLYDLGTHLLDQVFVLFGMPTTVSAKFVNQREGRLVSGEGEGQEPDSVSLVLSYAERGMLVYVRAGVVCVEKEQVRFWVRGSRGSYHKTGLDPQEGHLRSGGKATDDGFGKEGPSSYGRLCVVGTDGKIEERVCETVEPETYRRFYELFAKAVESGREEDVPVPAVQAAHVLSIIEAARESAKTGRDAAPVNPST
ncbi:hypothetical protein QBC34DRAFT_419317 [Podospora aff. communis PSN243]|uniref:Oxidoreductase n=1 Tax=Podospora aff. communis PSN243 TaxID=3040156 RepID=A0AAV9G0U4_9PEZI|nr:hypothetical protein QBC34DRAFT_419317 [Podospora aff. communis PSN243]